MRNSGRSIPAPGAQSGLQCLDLCPDPAYLPASRQAFGLRGY